MYIHSHNTRLFCHFGAILYRLKIFETLPSQFEIKLLHKLPIYVKFQNKPKVFKTKLKTI